MSQPLALLVDGVSDDLGDVAELFGPAFIVRALNEGQAAYEPEFLRERVAALTWESGVDNVDLPADFALLDDLAPDADSVRVTARAYGGKLYFPITTTAAFAGRLFYRAHYPDITDLQPCLLPPGAAAGITSYALSRCYRRMASSRSLYQRYSTLIGQAATIDDLNNEADAHLADFEAVRERSPSRQAETFFGE